MLNKTILFILLFVGCSQQNEHDSVACVNGAILTKQGLEDISERNKTLSRNEHISVWIEEELLYQAGKKYGVLKNKQVQTTVDAFARSLTIKKYTALAGLDSNKYSGHSLRSGFATSTAELGAEERSIMNMTGHKTTQMVRRYIQEANLFKNNALNKIEI